MSTTATSTSVRLLLSKSRFDLWVWIALAIAILAFIPVITLFKLSWANNQEIWQHLLDTVFWIYVKNTLLLCMGVALFTAFIGTGAAWLVTRFNFPLKSVFVWALLLPLAVPSYILAFVITDQLEYAGFVQKSLRAIFGWQTARDYWFPEIRSIQGAIAVLSLVLYPYVYLLARAAFVEQAAQLFEMSRCLGKSQTQSFFKVALPLARPAIVVGVTLALMETINEYGTVEFFAVPTLTAGIFDVWLNMSSLSAAAQIALMLVSFSILLLGLERYSRNAGKFYKLTGQSPAMFAEPLKGAKAWTATLLCLLPISLGFILPVTVLSNYALRNLDSGFEQYLTNAWNSFSLAAMAALLTTALGLLLAYGVRLSKSNKMRSIAEAATLGYAIPGAVLAVGILYPLGLFDNAVDSLMKAWFNYPTGLLLTGTGGALVLAYSLRFIALSYRTLDASLTKITPEMDDASRVLGSRSGKTLWRIHLPLIRPSLLTAMLLVFVDTMKELPITLILRPFNFNTLSTQVWDLASLEQLEQSALAALTILLAGILPVIIMSRNIGSSEQRPQGH
ncbi:MULTISPECIES: ABC transporter permease [unclassified Agarivorans]|uniref:ABC transporter permease n=1 Tax=unclassified Agarivorans TaxID=2636026 RepID=UPI0026E33BF1|nr:MULTISPECIES: iron ABC transporter permease [unclassified Agarivorans]MDO6686942.1 iron ABC transporter permease [Agarivorans sp. 3_MG-2023]MDO6716739.1 iron ABC transporter permease [Agarivorans sp. 2_MG-2023]